jgi:hypothetical protein
LLHLLAANPRLQAAVEGDHGGQHPPVGLLSSLGQLNTNRAPIFIRLPADNETVALEVVEMARQCRALDPQRARQVELRRPLILAQGVQDQPRRCRAALDSEGGVERGADRLRRHRELASDRRAAGPHASTVPRSLAGYLSTPK